MTRQLALPLPARGGRREGAGRPRTREHPGLPGPGVPHLRRPKLSPHHPVHVTQRVQPGVGYLRQQARARLIRDAMREVRLRFGLRVVHYSIQGNHLHLIVEVESAAALARGMQALGIRIAKALNALAGRRGGVFVDRYHAHALTSRRETANAVRYVLGNYRHHAREPLPRSFRDPLSSASFLEKAPPDDAPAVPPRTWLLRIGWKLEPPQRKPKGHEP
jgi:REP-associated tyrosine transposase